MVDALSEQFFRVRLELSSGFSMTFSAHHAPLLKQHKYTAQQAPPSQPSPAVAREGVMAPSHQTST